jgi:hypothetical protein
VTSARGQETVASVARLVRAKNAGPFWITIDVFFSTEADHRAYHRQITAARIAAIYGVAEASVRVFAIPQLRVVKVSFPRPVTQGGPFDRDVHAGQQHVPLLAMPLLDAAARPRWQPDVHGRPLSHRALDAHRAAVGLDHVAHDGESQAGSG